MSCVQGVFDAYPSRGIFFRFCGVFIVGVRIQVMDTIIDFFAGQICGLSFITTSTLDPRSCRSTSLLALSRYNHLQFTHARRKHSQAPSASQALASPYRGASIILISNDDLPV